MRLVAEPTLPPIPDRLPVPPPLPPGTTIEQLFEDNPPHPQRGAWFAEWEWRVEYNRQIDELEERLTRCSRDILEFGKEYFPDIFRSEFANFHRELTDLIFNLDESEWYYQDDDGNTLEKQGIVVAAPRGHAKCLSGEHTYVLLTNGSTVKLKDVVVGQEILSLNERSLRFERDVIVAKEHSGAKRVLRVRTRTGKELVLTPEHRVLTFDGWKVAGELALRDRIASPRKTAIEPTVLCRSDDEVVLLAYLLAEGGLTSGSVRFTNTDEPVIEDFKVRAHAMGFGVTKYKDVPTYGLTNSASKPKKWAEEIGIMGCGALVKRVPSWVFGLPERQKWLFLEALMVTDGWFAKQAGQGGITLANEALIDDINLILTHLGIIATKSAKQENGCAGAWRLYFGGDGVQALLDHCNLKHKRAAAEAIAATERYSLIDTYPDAVKSHRRHGSEWYRDNGLRIDSHHDLTRAKLRKMMALEPGVEEWSRLEQAEVFWDQIVSIEDAGEDDTYDVQVARNQNLVTNGLVTHNSTIITFLLPIYCSVFRIKRFIVIFSSNIDSVNQFCTQIKREIEENEKLRADFGDLSGKMHSRQWGAFNFVMVHTESTEEGSREIVWETMIAGRSIGTNVRGMRFGPYRPDAIVLDDVEKDENVQTIEQRNKLQGLLTQRILPMLDPQHGLFLMCGTLIHFDCLLARLLRPSSARGWVQRLWRCIKDNGARDILDPRAEPLWPEWWPLDKLRSKRLTPPMTLFEWNTEWMNDPRDPENREYKPEWVKWYHRGSHLRFNSKTKEYEWNRPGHMNPKTGEPYWQKLYIYQSVDPAVGADAHNDFFSMLTGGLASETHDVVIIHLVHGHFGFAEQVGIIESQFTTFPMSIGCAIETVQYQDVLRQTIIARQAKKYGVRKVPVKGIKQRRDRDGKVGRLRRRAWDMQTGTVWFPCLREGDRNYVEAPYSEEGVQFDRVRVHPAIYPLYQEMMEFPRSRNDDALDSFDMLLTVIGKRRLFGDYAQAERDQERNEQNPLVKPGRRVPATPGLNREGRIGIAAVQHRNSRRRSGREVRT